MNKKKSIFITGAAGGMGSSTARLFKKNGWFVGCYDINESSLDELKSELGNEDIVYEQLDVTKKSQFEECLSNFSKNTNDTLDILFNNAGITEGGFFDEIPYENHIKIININVIGVINGIYSAASLLKNTENSLCISTSSSSGIMGMEMIATYSATKHAIKGLTESLSAEFSRFDTRVSDILPGVIDTPMISKEIRDHLPESGMWRLISSDEIAETVWASYHSNDIHWYVPKELEDLEKVVANDPIKARDNLKNSGPLSKD
ncbi:MAG: short-chain dehydrogenase [Rhodobiaceae bacterium]|nr:short-chain dehydrogenase [Rhodobiaceae bacterium]|tara:strand:+ start:1164 stop:1946 length:783 start_codon:yes stop_codon:yes gene_type:complete